MNKELQTTGLLETECGQRAAFVVDRGLAEGIYAGPTPHVHKHPNEHGESVNGGNVVEPAHSLQAENSGTHLRV